MAPTCASKVPVRGVLAVAAGFSLNLMLGSFYTFGNVMPYVASYMRARTDPTILYSHFADVNMFYGFGNGVSLALSPLVLIPMIGNRMTVVVATLLYAGGNLLTRYAMDHSLGLVRVTFGLLPGAANMLLIPAYIVPVKWFPDHKGLVLGLVVAGFGFGSTIINPLQLAIANPNNVEPSPVEGIDDKFFTDPDVLDRVPTLFYALSALYATVMFTAMIFLGEPKGDDGGEFGPDQSVCDRLK